jgi:hypothetical protein
MTAWQDAGPLGDIKAQSSRSTRLKAIHIDCDGIKLLGALWVQLAFLSYWFPTIQSTVDCAQASNCAATR